MRTTLAVVAGFALLLTACGGSSSSKGASTTTIVSSTSPPTTTPSTTANTGGGFGTGGTASPSDAAVTLLRLDAPGKDFPPPCTDVPAGSSSYPKWAVNAIAVITCAPSSLPGGGAIGVVFANDDDLHTSLIGYNGTLLLDPTTADTTCPPANGDPSGVVVGGGKGGANSVLECRRFEGDNRPVVIWTSLANHEMWAAQGAVGMTDAALAAWWHANAK